MPSRSILALCASAILAGCGSAPSATPTFTHASRAYVSPYLQPVVVGPLLTYQQQIGPLPFDLEHRLFPNQALKELGEGLAFAPPPVPEGWAAVPFLEDAIAVVVHHDSEIEDLTMSQLAGLFAGRLSDWSDLGADGGRVLPVIPVAGDSLREQFRQEVLGEQRFAQHSRLSPSPREAIEIVHGDRGAIAFVPASTMTDQVQAVRIEGAHPVRAVRSGRYPLMIEILIQFQEEPQGQLRDFLAWIQDWRLSQPVE